MTIEAQVKCNCGFRTGYFDKEHAEHIGNHHAENCDTPDLEIKEREKTGTNYSDSGIVQSVTVLEAFCPYCEDPRDYDCKFCGKPFRRETSRDDHELLCLGP